MNFIIKIPELIFTRRDFSISALIVLFFWFCRIEYFSVKIYLRCVNKFKYCCVIPQSMTVWFRFMPY